MLSGVTDDGSTDSGSLEATGERQRFSSKILPPWCRKSPKVSEVLPPLYLHGLSSGDFGPALEQFKWPKAVAKITDDAEEPLTFYDFPAEHRIHLRTTNPIESTYSTVKLRTNITRGAGSAAAALAMVFKLVESTQSRWRAITGARLVPLVPAGARFDNGVLVERERYAA